MLLNSGTTGVRHDFLLPLGHGAWVIHNLSLTYSSKAFSQTFKMICKLRGRTSTCFISLVQFLFKQASHCVPKDWLSWGYTKALPSSVSICICLFVLWCSLNFMKFHRDIMIAHLTDEWTRHREVCGRGGSSELLQTQSVGTWLSALTANLPPSQVLCWASTFSQTDRFQTFFKLFASFFLCKVICIHQVRLR